MRKFLRTLSRTAPVAILALSAGCDVTGLQLQDFLITTTIRVVVQAVATAFQSLVVAVAGGGQ